MPSAGAEPLPSFASGGNAPARGEGETLALTQVHYRLASASGGKAPARGGSLDVPSASGRQVPACGESSSSSSTSRSVSFRPMSVALPVAPPPGITSQAEYELLSRARSRIKSRGESGPQSSAGAESFGEPEGHHGSTPDRNSNLPLDQSSGRSSRANGYDPPDDDDPGSSSSSSSSSGGGGGGGGGHDPEGDGRSPHRRGRKSRHRDKTEAGEIKLEALKPIAKYPEWCSSLADAVMAASGRGDKVWNWIQAPSLRNATMGAMARPGDKYRSLDAKLAKALRIAANGNAPYQTRIQEEFIRHTAEEEAKERPIRGRQLLLIVHQYYKTSEELGTHYGPKHIYLVKCLNDRKLEAFLNEWHTTLARIPKTVDEDLLREHFLEQMRNCDCMRHALNNYDAADPGDGTRTYDYLMAQANRQIAIRRQRENEEAIKSRLSGKSSSAAPAQSGQQHCTHWVSKGSCKKGAKCEYRHDTNRKGSVVTSAPNVAPPPNLVAPAHVDIKGKGKGKGKAAPKGDGKGKGDHLQAPTLNPSTKPCFEFSKGKCQKANKCPFVHRKLTPDERVKRDEWARLKESQDKAAGKGAHRKGAQNSNAACAAYLRGNCKKGAKCDLHHIDIGDRQTVQSAPARSPSHTSGQAAAGPAVIDTSGVGFVNSILRRAAPAFVPSSNSKAGGNVSH